MHEQFKLELLALVEYLLDPNKRLFVGYLAGAILFAFLIYLKHGKLQTNDRGFFLYLFNPRIWFHKSAILDYQLFIINRILRSLLWAPIVMSMVPIAIGLSSALEWALGNIQPITEQRWIVVFVFTLLLFLFDDFTRFLLHFIMHKSPFLWQFHKVHHSAKVLTPLTVYRSHPIENFLYATRMAIAQGTAVGFGYFLFGPTLSMYDILGANVFIFAFNIMGSNLRHSHIKWRWGNNIEKWLISPLQHQIHHSRQRQFFDCNFGTALAVWDRLFQTLVLSGNTERIVFGLSDKEASHRSLLDAYLRPFKSCLQMLFKKNSSKS